MTWLQKLGHSIAGRTLAPARARARPPPNFSEAVGTTVISFCGFYAFFYCIDLFGIRTYYKSQKAAEEEWRREMEKLKAYVESGNSKESSKDVNLPSAP